MSNAALKTDLYELTMAAAYLENGITAPATFELFIRSLPPSRGYLIACGLEQVLEYLEEFRFGVDEIDFLHTQYVFRNVSRDFFDYLSSLRFTGDVFAVEEGTPVFGNEPVLRITAPVIEAQLLETYLLSMITFQTSIATKAARCVESAEGRAVLEFGSRRAHGPDAGVLAARAAYVGGCAGSSNVEASRRWGIPTFGTLAHSFIVAYKDEQRSFEDFSRVFPTNSVLLLDTYDSLKAVDKAIAAGLRPSGVRLDSGDITVLSKEVRKRLDMAGLRSTKIVASSDLDEYRLADLLNAGAPIDVFGVGTSLATSSDAPALSGVYKMVEFAGEPRAKLSETAEKASYPGRKQIFRFSNDGKYSYDVIGLESEQLPESERLVHCVMRGGKRIGASPELSEIQRRASEYLRRLPRQVRSLRDPAAYPVSVSTEVAALLQRFREELIDPTLSEAA